jgi:hypothetical protein
MAKGLRRPAICALSVELFLRREGATWSEAMARRDDELLPTARGAQVTSEIGGVRVTRRRFHVTSTIRPSAAHRRHPRTDAQAEPVGASARVRPSGQEAERYDVAAALSP